MSGSEPIRPADPVDASADPNSFRAFGACGSRIPARSDTGLPLQLTAALPTNPLRVVVGDVPFAQVDMSVRNVSVSALQVMTSKGALMALTSDGVVVANPDGVRTKGYIYTIEPDATHDYKSTINLRGCDPTSGRLAPGRYQLHALQMFIFFDEDLNRKPMILVPGGPWEIEIG
jgi:hypothetical protein